MCVCVCVCVCVCSTSQSANKSEDTTARTQERKEPAPHLHAALNTKARAINCKSRLAARTRNAHKARAENTYPAQERCRGGGDSSKRMHGAWRARRLTGGFRFECRLHRRRRQPLEPGPLLMLLLPLLRTATQQRFPFSASATRLVDVVAASGEAKRRVRRRNSCVVSSGRRRRTSSRSGAVASCGGERECGRVRGGILAPKHGRRRPRHRDARHEAQCAAHACILIAD